MRSVSCFGRWRHAVGATVLLLSVLARPAATQDGLVVNGRYVSAVGNFGADLGPAPAGSDVPLAGGGRFGVLAASIVDRRTGTSVPIPETATVLAVDPILPRVFLRQAGSPFAVVAEMHALTGAIRPLTLVDATQAPPAAVTYAHAAGRLFIDLSRRLFQNPHNVFEHEVRVFDAATGAQVPGGFTVTAAGDAPWLVTPEGDYAYIAAPGGMLAIEIATGARRTVAEPVTGFYWDERNERLYANVGETLLALTRDATVLGSAAMGGCYAVRVSPHTNRLYVRRGVQATAGSIEDVRVFDASTYALLGQVFFPFRVDCTVAVFSAPGPPRAFGAAVSGRDVSLTWTNVGAASGFVLDVGFAPGRTDAQIYLGPDSHVTFANVPPGTYYLRLRGGNEFGGGRASSEVQVVVP